MKYLLITLFSGFTFSIFCQSSINAYAKVTNIAGGVLTVSNVDETDDTFEVGEFLIIMQSQDDVIGSVANNSSFGNLGSVSSAGRYEIIEISAISESGGVPTSITLNRTPTNSYNTGANSSLQVISFPRLGSPDYTTTSNLSATAWDGDIGGIIAFEVEGTLTLAHNIDANADGFRGGDRDNNSSGSCDVTTFFNTNTNAFAAKGEGIYRSTNTSYDAAKGHILNGGGGGNEHNGGGGGGGNYTAGGDAGPGWNCGGGDAGGLGGLDLSSEISGNRVFKGGGGGGGEGNNSVATDGGNGGGIVIILANEITTSGSCGGRTISANGESSTNAGNDGGGGGGAGGSIILQVSTWSIAATCDLTIATDGGNGGSVGSGNVHGGGGGGGQGVVVYTVTEPTTNIIRSNENGTGGCNNSSDPCNSQADSGQGTDDIGIIDETNTPLPIELLFFRGYRSEDGNAILNWATASEINCDYFQIYSSSDMVHWDLAQEESGSGNSKNRIDYMATDYNSPSGLVYYKLIQIDFDGTSHEYDIITIGSSFSPHSLDMNLFPNPSYKNQSITVRLQGGNKNISAKILLFNQLGTILTEEAVYCENSSCEKQLSIENLPKGVYFLNAILEGQVISRRLSIQ